MKNILITASLVLFTLVGVSQTKTAKAFYSGYDSDEGTYSFEEANGDYLSFNSVSSEVLAKFPLTTNKLEGKAYLITYTVKVLKDDEGYKYEELTITKLQEIKLEREEAEEDED